MRLKAPFLFKPTWKALPTHQLIYSILTKRLKINGSRAKRVKSCFVSLPYELASWMNLVNFVHARGEQWSQGALWAPRIRHAFDKNKKLFSGRDLDWFETRIGPYLPTCDDLGIPPVTGRLGCSIEGAGKRRIFAIGNYINQRLLHPIHKWVAEVLRQLPTLWSGEAAQSFGWEWWLLFIWFISSYR